MTKIVEIKNRPGAQKAVKIAFGLAWYVVDEEVGAEKDSRRLIKKMKETQDLRVFNGYTNEEQYALTSQVEGGVIGSYSAALALARYYPDRIWLAAIRLDANNIWICRGRNALVFPGGDIVVDEIEAYQKFLSMDPGSAAEVIIPADWENLPELAELKSSNRLKVREIDFFADLQFDRGMRITKVSSVSLPVLGAAVAAMVCLGSAISMFAAEPPAPVVISNPITAEDLGPTPSERRAERHARYDTQRPWISSLSVTEAFKACSDREKSMPKNIAGYDLDSFTCEVGSNNAYHDYIVNYGYIAWVKEWAEKNLDDSVRVDLEQDGKSFSLASKFTNVNENRDDMIVGTNADNRSVLISASNIEGASLTIGALQEVDYADPDYNPSFGYVDVTIASLRPDIWEGVLKKIPGFVMSSISSTGDNETVYTLKGQAYAKLR